ncbi:MAG TPA: hypothetical protein P5337_07555 [Aestuariivirga sp.]|nr:hypothetical protein [Aestuariivirga sp.]
MKLIEDLRAATAKAASPFAAQLLKEDIGRLERLDQLAATATDPRQFRKEAKVLGWTQGDLRTFELDPELADFVDSVYALRRDGNDSEVSARWTALHRRRMSLLVGCLSRPRIEDYE